MQLCAEKAGNSGGDPSAIQRKQRIYGICHQCGRHRKTVAEINKELLKYRIFGGYDLSRQMPSMGQSMLVCVTEKTDFSDIDTLAEALKKILSKEE